MWAIAALPVVVLVVVLAVPALRMRLLGPVSQHAPSPTPSPVAASAPSRSVHPTIQATPDRLRVPRPVALAPTPVARAEPAARAEPRQPDAVPATDHGTTVVVAAQDLGPYLDGMYADQLPAAAGPLQVQVRDGTMTISSEVDLEALREEMRGQVPDGLGLFLRGSPTIEVQGRIVDSTDGIAQFRLGQVRIGGLTVPETLLSQFLKSELEARGFVAKDPLVRPLFLPEGFRRATLEDGGLVLER